MLGIQPHGIHQRLPVAVGSSVPLCAYDEQTGIVSQIR